MLIRWPRISRSCWPFMASRSWPSNQACPVTSAPGTRPISAWAVTLLPDPDSPTMPSVSAARHLERGAPHGVHDAVRGVEPDVQVLDVQQRPGRAGGGSGSGHR